MYYLNFFLKILKNKKILSFTLLLICLIPFVCGIFSIPPLDRDESRFAQASYQMLEGNDYINIKFQDEIRAKKPVGIYWLRLYRQIIWLRKNIII